MKYKIFSFCKSHYKKIYSDLTDFLKPHNEVGEMYEYLFVVGGDGTLINQLKLHHDLDVKIVHIKCGNQTFLGEINSDLINSSLNSPSLFKNFDLFEISCKSWKKYAVNDIYVQGNLFLEVEIYIDNFLLELFRGFSLLISTQIGSTAFNKSINSPILFPSVCGWILSPLFPQQNKQNNTINSPIVFSKDNILLIKKISKNINLFIDNEKITFDDDEKSEEFEFSLIKSKAKLFRYGNDQIYMQQLKNNFVNQ